ncbi:LysM domain receptor-like kinase 4 [Morella rubra]|uniref:LysM domain receptor-like kinase 4 n=1 Tax=Morella rubra TaxID=262757 RepID=A0A6A1VPJ9_9ROSI|nr:LysM domain receptor-like kinase 4 [Morella rubra]
MKTGLLVLYLFTSFPTVLFKVLRGPFGCWVAFLAVAANLFWPESFPASRFLLFVITPDWLADGLRDSIFSGVVCLVVGVSLLITELGGIRRFGSCQWNFHCIASCLGCGNMESICFALTLTGREGVTGLDIIQRMRLPAIFDLGIDHNSCGNTDNSTSAAGYFCNGQNRSCQAYLTFRSQPPYNTVSTISALLSSDPSQLSQINSVLSETHSFETNQLVLVPVNCSCSGEYYQANASYVTQVSDTYFLIANNTFQGLSNCQALQYQNIYPASRLPSGVRLTVPLRCACPSKNQSDVGHVKYLLSYLVASGDSVSTIGVRFNVSTESILQANELADPGIFPFTTLLVPLQGLPSSSQTIAPPPPPPASPPPPNSSSSGSSSKTWVYVVVGILGGIALILVFGALIFCVFFRRIQKKSDSLTASDIFEAAEKPVKNNVDEESQDFLESMSGVAQSLKVYKFGELQQATDNFSPTFWIKGSVYRGSINGDLAAIKKIDGDVSKEINLLNKINHFNIICLSGICFNDGHWYLVYEYAVNGSLNDWIYNSCNDGKFLSWKQRMQIVLDVATGLNYLHGFAAPPHVHKDIKSSNILLDGDFRGKIANFGLARSAEGQEGEFSLTKHIVGTRGYMAPEYLEHGFVSTKLDVYAFAVVMMEIMTGKEVAALYEEENKKLSDVLHAVLDEDNGHESLRQFMDPSLQGNYPSELAVLLVRLIDNCLKKDPADRPSTEEMVHSLSRILNASLTWESSRNISA